MRKTEYLTAIEVRRVCRLLRETDTEIAAIAKRFGVVSVTILMVNKRFGIRHYYGKRRSWMLD